jgi:uncharacterized protein affecting Mg2+/Co2+ transport
MIRSIKVAILPLVLAMIAAVVVIAANNVSKSVSMVQSAYAITDGSSIMGARIAWAPLVMTGNNVYVTWSSNKSGDFEVLFRASTDGGKTFGPKINLSNSPGVVSETPEIAADGKNVAVTWFETNKNNGTNEAVFRLSTDNGKTFGPTIVLSNAPVAASAATS